MKKRICILAMSLSVLLIGSSMTAFATDELRVSKISTDVQPKTAAVQMQDDTAAAEISNAGKPVVRVQKTEWRYRTHEGRLQKRLWSITKGKWLTDWEDC